jgi:uncharacterized protein (DUF2236 family)
MIARIRRIHDAIVGTTPSGETYYANDPELLTWVHGTAAYGFLHAYHSYVHPLSSSERDRYYAEGVSAAGLYGATSAPTSEADVEVLFRKTASRLERSDIVFEFLAIARSAPILPLLLRPAQHLLVRADAALDADDPGAQRARLACLGSRGGAASRGFGGPPRSANQPGRSGVSADAPSC